MKNNKLTRIEVYHDIGEEPFRTFSLGQTVSKFSEACSDSIEHHPNHPVYSRSWYLVVYGKNKFEYKFHFDPQHPSSLIGYFVETSEGHTRYYGTFKSHKLKIWVEKHILNRKK